MKAIIPTILEKRGTDKWGSGEFGAPRGDHTHNGIDYAAPSNSPILAPVGGVVSKIGYAYGDDLSFRYVQITTIDGYEHRIFYVFPWVREGDTVLIDKQIGLSQDLTERYPGITPHIHYEVKYQGSFINPEQIS
jgi:murein DD-endopeptidase MepM/ murein hydrolase activator NlpD